ncbi:hypothetical protein ACHAWF_018029 [Thalassiosira exigua]
MSPSSAAATIRRCAAAVLLALPPPSASLAPPRIHEGFGVGRVDWVGARRPRRHAPPSPSSSSSSSSTALGLLKGLVPTVDDEISREIEDADLSSLELFQRELESGASVVGAYKAVQQRKKDKSGNYENKYKILTDNRSYSNRELLDIDHARMAPTLDDLNQVQPSKLEAVWVTGPYRLLVYAGSFFAFPYICSVLNTLVEVSPDEFDIINDQFTPGIGILYGTFVALTLDILYERQGKVQENASVEASLLSQVTQNVLGLFRDDPAIAREAAQIIADQVRIIVYRNRGSEMLSIMRADPYARLLSIVDHYQRDRTSFTPHQEALIDGLRGEIPALMEARAKRLSDEASGLPPTHFLVLLTLTALSLIGFTAATLTITDATGNPPLESRLVFAALSAVYVLFFNFCKDMNDPFDGVYQIKRSSAASYLLQIKWLIANQPFGDDVKFDTQGLAPVFDGNEVDEVKTKSKWVEPSSATDAAKSPQEPSPSTAETAAPGVSIITDSPQPKKVNVKVATPEVKTAEAAAPRASAVADSAQPNAAKVAPANPEVTSTSKAKPASTLLPERKGGSKAAGDGLDGRDVATREEVASQFESLSGFTGQPSEGGGVTVPAKSNPSRPVDRKKISMYFRRTGGFRE